ncbi:Prolyl 4-hydroxylase subunit alpha-1 [Anabarilius grahami]|uniref:procollagen-proline 4-dioxygenase n=1 Tax=Anabarilius grahami TaxID=495550 RepID=A0A3N0Z0M1_ANAGA|nr:Prolyl 4-hydroxylase subunit alpha-1 [Anabarilius grahami]
MRNPVAAYRLLRQMRNDVIYIVNQPDLYQCKKYQNESDAKLLEIPQLEDLDGAASGLIRLQEIYKLHPEDLTKETFLNADEAYNVGLVAYDEEKFQHAFLWFLYSLDRLTEYSNTDEEELLHYLSSSVYHFGSLSVAIYFSQELLNLDPSNDEARAQLNRLLHLQRNPDIFTLNTESSNYEALCRGEVDERRNPDIFTLNTGSSNYEALCRGEVDERISKRQRALSCRYSTGGGNPRLMYAPVKEEVEWDEPRIIRYHDIISDREIEILKNISRPQVNIERTQTHTLGNSPEEARVSQKIADATGLSMETAETLLVQNYGIGGAFEQHIDALMSDVEIGGATVFPKSGVAVQPKKGSAVFWYNLLRNGEVNWNTEHAGCPVLMGNKWVANKWIHELGQEFRRPCSLSEWE